MKVLIFGSPCRGTYSVQIARFFKMLRLLQCEALIEHSYARFLTEHLKMDVSLFGVFDGVIADADLAVSIGGDGAYLGTAAQIGAFEIPILGINTGHLGFLAEVSDSDIEHVFKEALNGQYKVEERTVLRAEWTGRQSDTVPFALNEVAALKQDLSSMINIETCIDGEFLHTYQADGLIIATPTGSTAYALSVGGPVITPSSHNWLVIPVASHSLTVRPLVIPDTCCITLKINSRSQNYMLSLDGRSQLMPEAVTLHISKAEHLIRSVQPIDHTFFKTLKNKLMWGADVRQK
ncbi:MAG: NAD kinase [Prevotellaceae bacterium]|jgi:NAD+ kinase|nr:NAD kinase [Prevotellaceae bacterium]